MMGAKLFFEFAVEMGAVSEDEAQMSLDRIWKGLMTASREQASLQRFERPEVKLLEFLKSAIASGSAHLADPAGGHPGGSEWGWRKGYMEEWKPQGMCVGWVDLHASEVYLDPTASIKAAQGMAPDGEGIAATTTVLSKRMKEAGLLLRTDVQRDTLTRRKTLQGMRRDVLHLSITTLQPDEVEIDEANERDHQN
jgi:hypothetical protein